MSDLNGISRGKTVPVVSFDKFSKNGIAIPMFPCTTQVDLNMEIPYWTELGCPDTMYTVDPKTYMKVPWADRAARVICDAESGFFANICPRSIAKQQLERLTASGYSLLSGKLGKYNIYLLFMFQ